MYHCALRCALRCSALWHGVALALEIEMDNFYYTDRKATLHALCDSALWCNVNCVTSIAMLYGMYEHKKCSLLLYSYYHKHLNTLVQIEYAAHAHISYRCLQHVQPKCAWAIRQYNLMFRLACWATEWNPR